MERRGARFALRDGVQPWTTHDRLAWCGRRRVWGAKAVDVRVRDGLAHFGGVALCGAIHVCPVCGPRLRQEKAADLDAALARWVRAHGTGSVLLLTLTQSHKVGMRLGRLLDLQGRAFRALTAGRFAQRLRADFGLRHHVRALDVTHGEHGWHPHLHVVLLLDAPLGASALAALGDALFAAWRSALVGAGRRAPDRRGFDLSPARNRRDLARYAMQVVYGGDEDAAGGRSLALEVTRGDLKRGRRAGHRTPFEILASAVRPLADADGVLAEDVERDRALWREWERTTSARKLYAVRWSPGLRAAVGLGAEVSDEDAVAVEVGGVTVYEFPDEEWRAVLAARARAAVLRAAERGGGEAVALLVRPLLRRWLARLARERARERAWLARASPGT